MRIREGGRGWAYAGVALGGVVSIAANVGHSYVPPVDAAIGWRPRVGAVAFAVVWPVFLFVAVEILARTKWKRGMRWVLLRFGGLIPVASVAAVVSYRHLSGLLAFYGEDPLTVAIGPLAVDGLMVMATSALIATGARHGAPAAATADTGQAPADVTADPVADSAPDTEADAAPPVSPNTKPTRAHVRRRPASADKVAKAAAKMPGATVAAIAAKAGVSESTARRHLPVPDAPMASPTPPPPAETTTLAAA